MQKVSADVESAIARITQMGPARRRPFDRSDTPNFQFGVPTAMK
jgi:hypothetical protein